MDKENQILDIFIEEIIPNRFQPRISFDEQKINELASSIKIHGIIQPLVLRKIGDKYEIIAGERRFKAATIAGLTKVPAIVVTMDDNQSAEVALVENLQRKDLTSIEEAKSYKKLLDRGYLSQEQLANKMGVSQSSIANKLRLLNLDETVQQALLEERISERHARSLLSLENFDQQKEFLDKIQKERLTVRQLDEEIKKIQNGNSIEKMEMFEDPEKIEKFSPNPAVIDTENINLEQKSSTENIFDLSQLTNIDEILSDESKEEVLVEPVVESSPETNVNNQPIIDSVFDIGQPIQENIENIINSSVVSGPVSDLTAQESVSTMENIENILPEVQNHNFFNNDEELKPTEQTQTIEQVQIPTFEELSVVPNLEIPNNTEVVVEPEKVTIEEAIEQLKPEIENPQALYSPSENIQTFELMIDKNDFRTIEDAFANLKSEIIKSGLKIDMDTYNFDQYYQLIIKIYK